MSIDKEHSVSLNIIKPKEIIEAYINQHDWRVQENANMSYNLSNLLLNTAGRVIAEYCLDEMYKGLDTPELHKLGYLHIHDLSGGIAPYCAGWSLSALLDRGINVGANFVTSSPAKHLRSAVNHMVNFLGIMSNEFMGACAFSDVDVLLAPYIYKEFVYHLNRAKKAFGNDIEDSRLEEYALNETIRDTTQSIQEFIYHLNMPNRWGGQSPFTNVVLDLHVPDGMKDRLALVGGNPIRSHIDGHYLTYGELQPYVDIFNKCFFRVYMQGDAVGKPFTFPVITINLTDYFFNGLDKEVRDIILEANAKTGATYFQNCINGMMNGRKLDEGDSRAMCCLVPDTIIHVYDNNGTTRLSHISWLFDNSTNDIIIDNPPIKILTQLGTYIRPKRIFRMNYNGYIYKIIFNREAFNSPNVKISYNEIKITHDHHQPIYYYNDDNELICEELYPDQILAKLQSSNNMKPNNKNIYVRSILGTLHKIINIEIEKYKGLVYNIEFDQDDCPFFIANDIVTHNCRLQIDVKEMLAYSKGLFSAGDYVGSVGVVTLNMAVVGRLARHYGKQSLFDHIEALMESAKESLLIKKREVIKNLKRGLFPFTREYLPYKEFESHFLTIGYCGLHECLLNFGIENGIVSEEGRELAKQILEFMNKKIDEFKEQTNLLFNLEATPAEGASFRLAKTAKKYIPDLILSGDDNVGFLTNSCHLPAYAQGDFVNVILHQNELQPLHSGGTVVHFYLGAELDKETIYNMLKKLAKSNLPYFTITPVISYCPIHGPIVGNYEKCPYDHTEEDLAKLDDSLIMVGDSGN